MLAIIDWAAPALSGVDLGVLKRDGYARLKVGTPDTFAPHAEGKFPTASGKTEFVSSMAARGNFVLPLFRQGSTRFEPGATRCESVPSYIAPRRVGPNQPRAGGALSAEYHFAQVSRLSEFLLREHAASAPNRGRAGRDAFIPRTPPARYRGGASSASLQRPRLVQGTGACERRRAAGRGGRAAGILAQVQPLNSTVNAANSSVLADLGNAPTFSDNLVEIEASRTTN